MELLDLPLHILSLIIQYTVILTHDLESGLNLRLVNKIFYRELERAYFINPVVDLRSPLLVADALAMSISLVYKYYRGQVAMRTRNKDLCTSHLDLAGRIIQTAQILVDIPGLQFKVGQICHVPPHYGMERTCEYDNSEARFSMCVSVTILAIIASVGRHDAFALGRARSSLCKNFDPSIWALVVAATFRNKVVVDALIERSHPLHEPEQFLCRPLRMAVNTSSKTIVDAILNAGGSVTAISQEPGSSRMNALDVACNAALPDMVKHLLRPRPGVTMSEVSILRALRYFTGYCRTDHEEHVAGIECIRRGEVTEILIPKLSRRNLSRGIKDLSTEISDSECRYLASLMLREDVNPLARRFLPVGGLDQKVSVEVEELHSVLGEVGVKEALARLQEPPLVLDMELSSCQADAPQDHKHSTIQKRLEEDDDDDMLGFISELFDTYA